MKGMQRWLAQDAYTWLWSPRTHRLRLGIALGSVFLYGLVVTLTVTYIGINVLVLSFIPLLIITLFFGPLAGAIAAVLIPFANVVLFERLGVPLWAVIVQEQRWAAFPILVLFAVTIGVLRDLVRRLYTLENVYRRTFAAVPDAILLVNQEGHIVRANPAVQRIFGYSPAELVGRPIEVVLPSASITQRASRVPADKARPTSHRREKNLLPHAVRKDGTSIPVDITRAVVDLPEGPTTIISVRDMSAHWEREALLHHVEKRYRLLFESAPVMYITTEQRDGEPIITECNWAFASILGYEREEIIGQPLAAFYAPQSRKALRGGGYQKALTGGLYGVERQLVTRDGRMVDTLLFAVPETDLHGRVIGTLAMFVDITRHKQMEATLRRREEELATRERILSLALRTTDMDTLLQGVLQELMGFTRAEMGGLYLREDGTFVLRAHVNTPAILEQSFQHIPVDAPYDWLRQATLVRERLEEQGRIHPTAKEAGIQARISLPLRAPGAHPHDPPVAVLILAATDYHAFNEEDIQALRAMAAQIALAIAHVQAIRQAQQRLKRLQMLRDIDRVIIHNLDFQRIKRVVVESIATEIAELIAISVQDLQATSRTTVRLPDGTIYMDLPLTLTSLEEWFTTHPEPLLLQSVTDDPRLAGLATWIEQYDLQTYLGIPLLLEQRVVGILHLMAREVGRFSEEDIAFFVTLAGQVAIAIANARMLADLKARAHAVETVLRAQLPQIDVLDEDTLEGHLLITWKQALSLEGIEFFRFDARRGRLHLTSQVGHAFPTGTDLSFAIGQEKGLVGWVAHTRRSLYLPDCSTDERWIPLRPEIRSAYFVPATWHGRLLGVVTFLSEHRDAFPPVQRDLIDLFVQQGAGLLENARLLREAKEHIALLTALSEIATELESLYTETEVVQAVGENARRICDTSHVAIILLKDATPHVMWHHGLRGETLPELLDVPHLMSNHPNFSLDEPYVVSHIHHLRDEHLQQRLAHLGYQAFVVLPLRHHDKLFGHVLCFWDTAHQPPPYELEVMRTFGHLAAAALDRAYLHEDLNRTNVALQEALTARDDMLRNVTHELRTPLTMVRGYAELMEMGLIRDPGDIKEYAQVILRNAVHLQHLLDQLLLFQQLRFGQRELAATPINVVTWLDEIVTEWRQPMQEAGLTLELEIPDAPLVMQGHPKYLRQVMTNLLDNARKFSPEGGKVTVRAWREGEEIYISVSDEGIGIPPEKADKVFERFYQIDASPTRRYGGMGIGLALCKEIVELHGGRIWVESAGLGQGTTVTFTVPAAKEADR